MNGMEPLSMVEEQERQLLLEQVRNLAERWDKGYWGENWKHVKALRSGEPDVYEGMCPEELQETLATLKEMFRLRVHYTPLQIKWIMCPLALERIDGDK